MVYIFRFRAMSGGIVGHRHTEITLFNVRFSESVDQYRSNAYCNVFWAYFEHPCHFQAILSHLESQNQTSKFWRQIQILPDFHENRRYLDPEAEIKKSVPYIQISHLSSLCCKKAFVDIYNTGPTRCRRIFGNLTLKTT